MRIFVYCCAIVLGLAGLWMTSCGAYFSALSMNPRDFWLLLISVPSMALGIGVIYLGLRVWRSQNPKAAPRN